MVDGILPKRLFAATCINRRFNKLPIVDGILPVSLFVYKYI